MKKKTTILDNSEKISAEEKIKQTARTLFTQKGFAATKTREIAEKSGINLALLNYYFRSKQKLYDIIMEENMMAFRSGIISIMGNTTMTFDEKIETLVAYYIDAFIENRDLPVFIISIIHHYHNNPTEHKHFQAIGQAQKVFMEQISSHLKNLGGPTIHPAHFITNLMSLIFFPFASSGMLKARNGLSDNDFISLMQERKKLIPSWIKSMIIPTVQTKSKK